jgi:PDDEXK-like domain of unknown function (DUF3799)
VIPRLHQSIAKTLAYECPAVAKAQYDAEIRKPSRAMEKGTLVDQLVLGGANFHVIDARYKSGPRKGEPVTDMAGGDAPAQAAEARSKGMVPVLPDDLEKAQALAGAIKSRLLMEGIELDKCSKQEYVEWTTAEGVEAAGTPDLVFGSFTIDLKVGHTANPDKLEQHVFDQGWHLQGAAYQEATKGSRHYLVCAETKSGADCITIVPLSPAYIDLGMRAWRRAQHIWVQCWTTNEWPEYTARPLQPTKNALFREGLSV